MEKVRYSQKECKYYFLTSQIGRKRGENLFLDQKSSVKVLLSSIDSLNEQINSYLEVDYEIEMIKHNENETLYRLRVSQCLSKLEVVKNDVTQLTAEAEACRKSKSCKHVDAWCHDLE